MNLKLTTEYILHKHTDQLNICSKDTGRAVAQWTPEGLQVCNIESAQIVFQLKLHEEQICMFAFDMHDGVPQTLTFEHTFEVQRVEHAGCHILADSAWVATWTPQGLETPHQLPLAYSKELCDACYKLVTA